MNDIAVLAILLQEIVFSHSNTCSTRYFSTNNISKPFLYHGLTEWTYILQFRIDAGGILQFLSQNLGVDAAGTLSACCVTRTSWPQ